MNEKETAKFYKEELEGNKNSVIALIAILKDQGTKHPQYYQLTFLEQRVQEINNQLTQLDKIINN